MKNMLKKNQQIKRIPDTTDKFQLHLRLWEYKNKRRNHFGTKKPRHVRRMLKSIA